MNNRFIFKYVNSTILFRNTKFARPRTITTQSVQTRDLRPILDAAAKELNITTQNDWYKLPIKDYPTLLARSSQSFEKDFNSSPYQLLSLVYPEHEWLQWKFEKPKDYWADITNVRKFMDWIGKELGVKEMSDWYNISYTEIKKRGGAHVLQLKSSYYELLKEVYPEYDWLPWKFAHSPKFYWEDINNIHTFMNWAAKELGIKEMSDWYNVSSASICKIGGRYLLSKYTYAELLAKVYPDYDWLPWKFVQMPIGYWNDIKNARKYMDWAGKQLGVVKMSDWYNVLYTDLFNMGGSYLLKLKSSFYELLAEVYPEYDWLPWRFDQIPLGYWNDIKNVRKYMDWAGKQLGIKQMSDWYNVSVNDLNKLYGTYLLKLKSLVELLTETYPEYNWQLWKFSSLTTKRLFLHPNKRDQYVKWIAKQLNIINMSDWYKVKAEQIIDLRAGILLIQSHTLPNLLSTVYPECKWEESQFEQQTDICNELLLANYFVEWLKKQEDKEISLMCKYVNNVGGANSVLAQALKEAFPTKWIRNITHNTKKSQYVLKDAIANIFNEESETIIMEEYKHPDDVTLELDYFLPEYKIAFEYQGQQHYKTTGFLQRESLETVRERDRNKVESCKQFGITLIEVPYWWDRKIDSLAATIYNLRPDLFEQKPQGNPIPMQPPQSKENDTQKTNTTKQALMTATEWDYDNMEPKGWFMTEKYDGMRLYWDGTQCYSRPGNKINIPISMSSQLPPVALDGEIWTQYGLFQEATSLAKAVKEEKWRQATFWIFDAPKLNKPLEERISFLQQLQLPSFAKVVEFVKCEGKEHLKQFNDAIIAKGGEGVMLGEPGSMYKSGRSTGLRKFKPYFDTEVKVVKNQHPHGLQCEQANGRIVFVNADTSEEVKAIKKGAVVTVKYSGTNAYGTLLYPQFYRVRTDVSWNDLSNKDE